jgi:hypothetical protein
MRNSAALVFSAGVALSALAGAAAAAQIDLSSVVNANLNTYTDGTAYPANGGPITIAGIDFALNALPGGGTGIVQAPGLITGSPGPSSFAIPVGEAGVTTVYSIVNSAFGAPAEDIGFLTFTGSGGATFSYHFIEGDNVRDHANTVFENDAPNVFGTANFTGGDRLDVQRIVLPSAFAAQTLTTITFASNGDTEGQPFLAALTTSTAAVPEPAAWALMLIGFGGVGVTLRRRRTGFRTV